MLKRLSFVAFVVSLLALPLLADQPAGVPRSEVQLVEATVADLQHALRTGLLTSEQLVKMYLARIDKYEPTLNAFIYINPNAVDEARALDAARKLGVPMGPLYGIPVLLKDNIDTADMPTTAGSVALEGSIPPHDAVITQKLRDAGAIILGKATLTEFANFIAVGMPTGYSSLGRFGFNPYYPVVDPRTTPPFNDGRPALQTGGSSSGSGIAVAASLVTLAIGTETSGSILSPASANGDVGIKTTVGLVSRTGILPITADQDTPGPIARTVADAAAMLGVIAGYDADDPATAPCLTAGTCFSDYTGFLDKNALKGARIAVPHNPYWVGFNADQETLMNNAIAALRAAGAYVADPYEIPNQADISAWGICAPTVTPTCSTVLMYGQKHDLNAYLAKRGDPNIHTLTDIINFNEAYPDHSISLKYGQAIFLGADALDVSPGSADTLRYQADRAKDLLLTRGGLDAVYNGPDGIEGTADDFDAILFPQNRGAGAPAKAGYPSITVTGGMLPPTTPSGGVIAKPFPAGVTFSGRAFSEPRLIALAYAYEQATRLRETPYSTPALATDYVHRPQ